MNGRNVFLLVQLTPGVVPINGALNFTGGVQRPGVEVSAFRINGRQAGSLAYMLDGSPLTVLGYGVASRVPPSRRRLTRCRNTAWRTATCRRA